MPLLSFNVWQEYHRWHSTWGGSHFCESGGHWCCFQGHGNPLDLNGPEQSCLGPPLVPQPSGPDTLLKLRPGPFLSQLPDLFFLDGAWRDTTGSLFSSLFPGWGLDICPSLVFGLGSGSCCSPLGLNLPRAVGRTSQCHLLRCSQTAP